ncbi:hypothetical protein MKW92_032825 [Papaver armeniacum]|nr:hypothetical protein MKW92_032825 [Papaver armeniacum]
MSYPHPHHQQQIPVPEPTARKSRKPILLRPRRTNPIIWCGAFLCIIFSIILIYVNGDFTFLANFSNPNRKIDMRFEYLDIELKGEARPEAIHMISSEVYSPPNLSTEPRNQVRTNEFSITLEGHSECLLEMTGPPTGVLIARSCRTKR